ncbi:hypothetical protein [Aeromicrobium panaciterrae]
MSDYQSGVCLESGVRVVDGIPHYPCELDAVTTVNGRPSCGGHQ